MACNSSVSANGRLSVVPAFIVLKSSAQENLIHCRHNPHWAFAILYGVQTKRMNCFWTMLVMFHVVVLLHTLNNICRQCRGIHTPSSLFGMQANVEQPLAADATPSPAPSVLLHPEAPVNRRSVPPIQAKSWRSATLPASSAPIEHFLDSYDVHEPDGKIIATNETVQDSLVDAIEEALNGLTAGQAADDSLDWLVEKCDAMQQHNMVAPEHRFQPSPDPLVAKKLKELAQPNSLTQKVASRLDDYHDHQNDDNYNRMENMRYSLAKQLGTKKLGPGLKRISGGGPPVG